MQLRTQLITRDSSQYSHPAIIRVLDESGTLAVTLELADDFSRAVNISAPLFDLT